MGFQWNSMEFRGIALNLLNSFEFHGIPWNPLQYVYVYLSDVYELSMVLPGPICSRSIVDLWSAPARSVPQFVID